MKAFQEYHEPNSQSQYSGNFDKKTSRPANVIYSDKSLVIESPESNFFVETSEV